MTCNNVCDLLVIFDLLIYRCWKLLSMEMRTCWTITLSYKKLLFGFTSIPTSQSSTRWNVGARFARRLHTMVAERTRVKPYRNSLALMSVSVVFRWSARFLGLMTLMAATVKTMVWEGILWLLSISIIVVKENSNAYLNLILSHAIMYHPPPSSL